MATDTEIPVLMWNEPAALIDDVVHSIDSKTGDTICGEPAVPMMTSADEPWYQHSACPYCFIVARGRYVASNGPFT